MGVIDSESHDTLVADLRSLPMFPYFRSIDVVPVIPYAPVAGTGRGHAQKSAPSISGMRSEM
jgi:hypothetical protein